MEKLDESDVNGHRREKNINNFVPLYESDNEEVTKHRKKSKIPSIVLSEKDNGIIHKEFKTRSMKKM